jgi:transposase
MAMGKRGEEQNEMYVSYLELPQAPGHVFYEKLDAALALHCFETFAEERCRKFYAPVMGRPSLPPVVYFKMLFIGYFEGIEAERGIAWRVKDSLSLRRFLGYALTENTPDHSTVSRTRRRIDVETHREIFQWVVTTLALEGLIDGKTLGVDSTTLEANAALRSIIRRDTGEAYNDFLVRLAQASGIETPTRDDLAKLDRDRKNKGSNEDWMHPHDPDARITKMKDGSTHLAHKAEHAVDMETGAVVAVTLQPANEGDTQSLGKTLDEARENLEEAAKEPDAKRSMHPQSARELVADKGYHSNGVLGQLEEEGVRTYLSEPKRGRRKWRGKEDAQQAVYANRRRIQGERGKRLLRKRGELIERSFAHCYETGAMRRCPLRERDNILKRLLVHVGAFNLGLLMRTLHGAGTPRQMAQAPKKGLNKALQPLKDALGPTWEIPTPHPRAILKFVKHAIRNSYPAQQLMAVTQNYTFATGC